MKYKLGEKHPELDLYRVVALKDFGNVEKGDVGGWVESEKNLSQEGDCWVYGSAKVYGNACVSGNAWVSGSAVVSGNAQVSGDSCVYDNACVSGSARVSGGARVFGNAWVYGNAYAFGNAWVYGNARVSGDSICTRKVYIIELDKDPVTATDNHIQIGCELHTYEYWMENYRQIGEKSGYTESQIEMYGKIICYLNTLRAEK